MVTAMELALPLHDLETTPASEVKTKGWPELMRKVASKRVVAITNHNRAQAVVMSVAEYERLVEQASSRQAADARAQQLAALQAEFDGRLAALQDGRLGKALARPARRGARISLAKPL